jgi:putative methionine-R-sulfoxide reductase with GAF domain
VSAALGAIEAIVGRAEGDADDVLRAVVAALVEQGGCSWAGIRFSERGELVLGPQAGEPDPSRRTSSPVVFEGDRVAELAADRCDDVTLLPRVAELIAAHCLVGWDTGGEAWAS